MKGGGFIPEWFVEAVILIVVGLFIGWVVVLLFLWVIERLKDRWSRLSLAEWKKNHPNETIP